MTYAAPQGKFAKKLGKHDERESNLIDDHITEIDEMSERTEMEAIAEMVSEAEKAGLLCEVIRSFWIASKSGSPNIEDACEVALVEWDI